MRSSPSYYQLVASLPHLPRLREAERLPINAARLQERLRLLRPEDAEVVARFRRVLQWQDHPPVEADAEISRQYRELLGGITRPPLRRCIEFRAELRTVVAALRRRNRGEIAPPSDPDWGLGDRAAHITRHWTHPDFRLAHVFPWIPEIRRLLEQEESLALEERLMNLVWDSADRLSLGIYFELETVVAFLIKWDILRRWLSYEREPAKAEFARLAEEMFADLDESSRTASAP